VSEEPIRVPSGLTTDGLLGRRYLARIVDTILITLLVALVFTLARSLLPPAEDLTGQLLIIVVNLNILVILWIGYGTLLESSSWQATVGKRFMGLQVYDATGGRLTLLQALGRNLLKDGPFLALAFIPIGRLLTPVWLMAHLVVLHRSPVYQAIHDRAAHTWVAAPEQTTQLHLT